MSARDPVNPSPIADTPAEAETPPLLPEDWAAGGVVIARLVGIESATPLVLLPQQTMAVAARSAVALRGAHVGMEVVLNFEGNDRSRPIVVGLMRDSQAWCIPDQSSQIEVDADGRRVIVSARNELVLRCGAASITLEQDGRVTIRGTRIVSHSEGVNRIHGGSVQLN